MANEKELRGVSGWLMVVVLAAIAGAGIWVGIISDETWIKGVAFWLAGAAGACFVGLTVVNPNEASVVTLFGVYKGTLKRSGFWWVNPLTTRRKLSLRVRNFESARLKVNERDGNPIEIATVVVWRIIETFEAVFNVDDY
jgi:regulator of protease activity HflC (stomatin/prohibitin superfamily)